MAQDFEFRYEQLLDDVAVMREVGPEEHYTNIYLLGRKGSAVLVDAGQPEGAAGLIAALERHGWKPADVERIVITHEHGDHNGAVPELRRWAPHVQVLAHVYCAWYMTQRWTRFIVPGWPYGEPTPENFKRFQAAQGMFLKVDGLVWNDGTLTISGRPWRVLHVPGHAQGHIILADEARRVVLTGDLLQGVSAAKLWLGLFTDIRSQRQSLGRLRDLKASLVLMGHHAALRDGQVNEEMDRAAERIEVLLDVVAREVQAGDTNYESLARKAYRRVFDWEPEPVPPYAIGTVRAVLAELCFQGLVRFERTDRWTQ